MTLDDELLYVFVFGPGFGESVVVRVPPNDWFVIDCLTIAEDNPSLRLLKTVKAPTITTLLTHSHQDHGRGLDLIIQLDGATVGKVGCSDPRIVPPHTWTGTPLGSTALKLGGLEHTAAAIDDRWTADCVKHGWVPRRDDPPLPIGAATIRVLHPDTAAVDAQPSDPNEISTAIRLDWEQVAILLAADVVNPHWASITNHAPADGYHFVKVPHHCSDGAIDASWLDALAADGCVVATPYNSKAGLPDFAPKAGLSRILAATGGVDLTSAPVAHEKQSMAATPPEPIGHDDLADRVRSLKPSPKGSVDDVRARMDASTSKHACAANDWCCYAAVGFDRAGAKVDVRHGIGSLRVSP